MLGLFEVGFSCESSFYEDKEGVYFVEDDIIERVMFIFFFEVFFFVMEFSVRVGMYG